MSVTVQQLFVFPVKSLRGFAVESAELTPCGLKYDRYWMIVKPDGGFLTQRQQPQMVLLHTTVTDDSLILTKQGMASLEIPLKYSQANKKYCTVTIWKDRCQVMDEGDAAGRWITAAMASRQPLRLVRMQPDALRPQGKPELLGEHTHTRFADAAPYLICNQSSLDAVNRSMKKNHCEPVTMERFRPNIVTTGLEAFEEHQVQVLEHPDYSLAHCYHCQRCVIPTIDPETGIRHPQQQPFRILAQLNPVPGNPKAPAFGENAILTHGAGQIIRVGDKFSLLARATERECQQT